MKALTIRQPWAHLIVHGPKRIENRSWPCEYPMQIALHAAKTMTGREYTLAGAALAQFGAARYLPRHETLAFGAVLGVATVVDCVQPIRQGFPVRLCDRPGLEWWETEQHGWVLEDVRALPEAVPCLGALGLWDLPVEIERRVVAMLAACAARDGTGAMDPSKGTDR